MTAEAALMTFRDGQVRSPFALILERLCDSCAGVLAAGIADEEGETVDIATLRNPTPATRATAIPAYDIKLACAHFQLALRDGECDDPRRVNRIDLVAASYSYVIAPLQYRYVMVVIGEPVAASQLSNRALREAVVGVSLEAGWDVPALGSPCWRRVRVRSDTCGKPDTVDGHPIREHELLPLDTTVGFEKAYRVTVDSAPRTLVREPTGHWYLQIDPPRPR